MSSLYDRPFVVAVGDPNIWANVIKPNADGSINVDIGFPVSAGVTDDSATTTGSDQTVIAANSSRKGFLIENPVNTSLNSTGASIWVNLGAAAANTGCRASRS